MALFIKLSTTVLTDEKFDDLSDSAGWLWVKAMLYSKEHETYGMVTEKKLRAMCAHHSDESFNALVSELVEVGLWEREHNAQCNVTRYGQNEQKWDRHQSSRNDVEALRSANAARQKRFREKHKQVQEEPPNVTHNVTSNSHNANVTGPEQSRAEQKQSRAELSGNKDVVINPERSRGVGEETNGSRVSTSSSSGAIGRPVRAKAKRGTGASDAEGKRQAMNRVDVGPRFPRKSPEPGGTPPPGKHLPESTEEQRATKAAMASAVMKRDQAWRDRPPGQTRAEFAQAFADAHPAESAILNPVQEAAS